MSQDLKAVEEQATSMSGGGMFKASGSEAAKAQRQEHAQCVPEMAKQQRDPYAWSKEDKGGSEGTGLRQGEATLCLVHKWHA